MFETTDVLVIGSLNHDIVADIDHVPDHGETVLARKLARTNGGKGGNQAVAAARAGAKVRMVSAVGADAEGAMQIEGLAAHGVDASGVRREPDVRTSLALIWVTPDGENSIIVTPGAKDRVTPELIGSERWKGDGQQADVRVVLAQSEVGAAVLDASATLAVELDARYVLSCGPVILPSLDTLCRCDPIIVNAGEARDLITVMGAVLPQNDNDLAASLMLSTGANSVIVTLGSHGSLVAERGHDQVVIPPIHIDHVVDTTGAGDTYCGVVAARLALGGTLLDACYTAAEAAAKSVTWKGARPDPSDRV